jgi:hypothetical protein
MCLFSFQYNHYCTATESVSTRKCTKVFSTLSENMKSLLGLFFPLLKLPGSYLLGEIGATAIVVDRLFGELRTPYRDFQQEYICEES